MIRGSKAAVIGTGVIGLTTALQARHRELEVTVYHVGDLPDTCSSRSAASFKPHEVVYDSNVDRMLVIGWNEFDRIAHADPLHSGVRLHTHWEAFSAPKARSPYLHVMKNFVELKFPDVPGGYAYGWKYETFFIDMSVYLPWLKAECEKMGVRFKRVASGRFSVLSDLTSLEEEIIFNCTGMGARTLCGDNKVYPIKGQVVLIGPIQGMERSISMEESISADGFYVYPRKNDTVLGGTTEHRVDSEHNDAAVTQVLLRAHKRILPKVSESDVLTVSYGLRPYREAGIRIEKESVCDKTIIHNYGHGGSGVTLSPGSASMALDLL